MSAEIADEKRFQQHHTTIEKKKKKKITAIEEWEGRGEKGQTVITLQKMHIVQWRRIDYKS